MLIMMKQCGIKINSVKFIHEYIKIKEYCEQNVIFIDKTTSVIMNYCVTDNSMLSLTFKLINWKM